MKTVRGSLKKWRQPSWLPVMAASCRQFSNQPAAGNRCTGRLGSCSVEKMPGGWLRRLVAVEISTPFRRRWRRRHVTSDLFYRAAGKPATTFSDTLLRKFGSNQFFDMKSFVEMSRRIQWPKNEFPHRLSPEPAAVGAGCHRATGSAVASVKPRGATPLYGVPVASRRRLSFFR